MTDGVRRAANRRLLLGFTPQSGQTKGGLIDTIVAAGFVGARIVDAHNFCVLATKPA